MHPLISLVLRAAAALSILAASSAVPLAAQEGAGTAEGVARAADGAPLPFLLVRLVPAGADGSARGVVTDAEGRFRFAGVPAGEYHLHVEQIGYERTRSPLLRVRAGETLFHEVRSAARPIQLEAVTVRAGACLTAGQLADDPELAALWNEAKKGVETRRAFDLQYRYTETILQEVAVRWRIRGTVRRQTRETEVNEPDSVRVRTERRRARLREVGYAHGDTVRLPVETDLLEDEFLRDHCLDPAFEETDGAYVLRFRPVRPRPDAGGIRGTITVDAESYLIRRLTFEYLDGGRAFAEATVEYEDVPVAGSTLRLPVRGNAAVRARSVGRLLATGATSVFTFHYEDFQPVRAQ